MSLKEDNCHVHVVWTLNATQWFHTPLTTFYYSNYTDYIENKFLFSTFGIIYSQMLCY